MRCDRVAYDGSFRSPRAARIIARPDYTRCYFFSYSDGSFPFLGTSLLGNLIVEGRDLVREVHVRDLERSEFLRGNTDG